MWAVCIKRLALSDGATPERTLLGPLIPCLGHESHAHRPFRIEPNREGWRRCRYRRRPRRGRSRRRRLLALGPPPRAHQVELLDHSSPFARKPDVVAYERHVLFTSDDPTDATRHRASSPKGTTRIDEAFVNETPEQLVGSDFAQANALSYACKRVWAPSRAGK